MAMHETADERGIPAQSEARTPPASLDAERSVLGTVLMDPTAVNVILEHLKPEDFYRPAHQSITQAMIGLIQSNNPIDTVTLAEQMAQDGTLEKSGGITYISGLLDAVVSTTTLEHHTQLIAQKSLMRRMIYTASEIVSSGYGESVVPADFIEESERALFSVLDSQSRTGTRPIREVLKETIDTVQRLYERKEGLTGVTTGFKGLDNLTLGLQPSDLVILAARPAMGKTTLALNIACNAALQANAAVAVFSLEMSSNQLVMRLLSAESRVDLTKLRSGVLSDSDWPKLANAAQRLAAARIFIDETPAITPLDLRARCRRLALEGQLDLIVIDYLQLMSAGRRIDSREQQISEISRSLKALAKELHVPIMALSQLNRGLESRTDKRPLLSDLRESGAIEQDADLIMFIHREEVYNKETEAQGIGEIIVGKHRNGPTGTVKTRFFKDITRFENLAHLDG
jgi:replicative DNA helicase